MAPPYPMTPRQITGLNTSPSTYTITYNSALETFLEWLIITYLLWALVYLVYVTLCGAISICQTATRTWIELCTRVLVIGPYTPRWNIHRPALETSLLESKADVSGLQTIQHWQGYVAFPDAKDTTVKIQLGRSTDTVRKRGGTV